MIAVELAFERSMRREAELKAIFPKACPLRVRAIIRVRAHPCSYLFSLCAKWEREIGESIAATAACSEAVLSGIASRARGSRTERETASGTDDHGPLSPSFSPSLSLCIYISKRREWPRTASSVLARAKKAEDNGATSPCHRVI